MHKLMRYAALAVVALAIPATSWATSEPPLPGDWAMPAQEARTNYQRIARDMVLDVMLEGASTVALTFYRGADPTGIAVEQDVRVKLSEEQIRLEYRLAF